MIYLPSFDKEAIWETKPEKWNFIDEEILKIDAAPKTDLFNDPNGKIKKNNSAKLLIEVTKNNFIFYAKVKVDFKDVFDAGVLILYSDKNHWAKFCFEFSPQKEPTIVSVVNNELSDDCNSVKITSNDIYLRISKINKSFAFHYSINKKYWHMVRYFSINKIKNLKVGFSVQSPVGNGCRATFSDINLIGKKLKNIRNGS